jgi:hypothetical protein
MVSKKNNFTRGEKVFLFRMGSCICKSVPLDFVSRLNYKTIELRSFASYILLPSSGRKEEGTENIFLALPDSANLRSLPSFT